MAYDEQPGTGHEGGLYASSTAVTPQRSAQRRKQAVVGIAGAAAVLAGAGFLVIELMHESQPTLPEPEALAPLTTPATAASAAAAVEPSVTRTPKVTRHAAPVERSPVPKPAASREAIPEQGAPASVAIDEPRERAGDRSEVTERTEPLGDGTIRIVSARRDLSGERQMLLAGDDGEEVGRGVRCTTDVRYGLSRPSAAPQTLLCWRTSASRSVITMASSRDGEPPTAGSVDAIDREWSRLE